MLRLLCDLPHLDQAGHVYVPLAGPGHSCLRLNRYASQLWRRALGEPVDMDLMAAADRDFLSGLVRRGVLRTENVSRGEPEPR